MNTPPQHTQNDITDMVFLKIAYLLPSLDMTAEMLEQHRTVLEKASSFYSPTDEEINLFSSKSDDGSVLPVTCGGPAFPWGGTEGGQTPVKTPVSVDHGAVMGTGSGETLHQPSQSSEQNLPLISSPCGEDQEWQNASKPVTVVEDVNDQYVDPFQDDPFAVPRKLTLGAFQSKWQSIRATLKDQQQQPVEMDLETLKKRTADHLEAQDTLRQRYIKFNQSATYLTHKQWMKTILLTKKLKVSPEDLQRSTRWSWRNWWLNNRQQQQHKEHIQNVEHIRSHIQHQHTFAIKRGLVTESLATWEKIAQDMKKITQDLEIFTRDVIQLQRAVMGDTRHYRRTKSQGYRQKQQQLGIQEIDQMMHDVLGVVQTHPHLLMSADGFMQLMLKKEDIHWQKRRILKHAIQNMPSSYKDFLMNYQPKSVTLPQREKSN